MHPSGSLPTVNVREIQMGLLGDEGRSLGNWIFSLGGLQCRISSSLEGLKSGGVKIPTARGNNASHQYPSHLLS